MVIFNKLLVYIEYLIKTKTVSTQFTTNSIANKPEIIYNVSNQILIATRTTNTKKQFCEKNFISQFAYCTNLQ